jgi:alkylation response protein AidB-like acyl-CoA dehydrogenase
MGSEPAVELDGAAILANARALDSFLREKTDEIERARQLTPPVVEALRKAGIFRMGMPRSWGGPEMTPVQQIEVIEALSRANGSVGWCSMIAGDGGFHGSMFDEEIAHKLWPGLDLVTAGWLFPGGRMDEDGDGYRLNGKWTFASGCTHADVMLASALLYDGEAPVLGDNGLPQIYTAVMPASEVKIIDTWHTTGLAATGSNDYALENHYVPRENVWALGSWGKREGPLYGWPGMFLANILGVPLGVARDAIDTATKILAEKVVLPAGTTAKDDVRVRSAIAKAEAMVGACRSYSFDVWDEFYGVFAAGEVPNRKQRAAVAGCYVFVLQTCRDAVALLYDIVGSTSIYRKCPLDRQLRDLFTATQHVLGQVKLYDNAGSLWFDEEFLGLPGL